jgi:hypothetical protein
MKHFAKLAALTILAGAAGAGAQQYAPPPPPPDQQQYAPPPGQQQQYAPPPQQYAPPPGQQGQPPPGPQDQQAQQEELAPPPPTAAPGGAPPPPSGYIPPPSASAPAVQLAPPRPKQGEWTYTAQYGWLWMPYERNYTYVVDGTDTASMYVFYPHYGWRWINAPWVIGIGPTPRWGPRGPGRFVFYSRPWFRSRRFVGRRNRVIVREPVRVEREHDREHHHW